MKRRLMGLLAAMLLCMAATGQAQTASVTKGAVEKTVFGSGKVQPASQPGVYAQISGDVAQTYVGMGDRVSAGDVLVKLENEELDAEVDQLEYEIQLAQKDVLSTKDHTQYVYKQLYDEDGEARFDVNTGEPLLGKYSNEITVRAPCAGRIMAVYIQEGDDALAKFREYGSVVVLSTDGKMKVEIGEVTGAPLALNEEVRVTGEGVETAGKVISLARHGTQAVIQVGSDEFPMDTPVTVENLDGAYVGEGILEINKPIGVSAYGGTIKGLAYNIKVGSMLKRYDVIARIVWEEIPLYLDNAEALREYARAKVELENAQAKVEALTIVAPCDGVVATVDVEKGDSVEDGALLLSLVEDGAGMSLILEVDELDIVSVQPGQAVRIAVDALSDVTLTGVVDKIAPLGNTGAAVTTYDVYVTLTGEVDSRVLGGMNVTGEIVVSRVESALTIPTDALRKDENGWYVTLSSGEQVGVEIGVMTDSRTEILSGLYEGETLVY